MNVSVCHHQRLFNAPNEKRLKTERLGRECITLSCVYIRLAAHTFISPEGYDLHFNHSDGKMNPRTTGRLGSNELMHVNGHFKVRLGAAY